MALYERLASDGADNINIHGILGVVREILRGHMTAADGYEALRLDADEQVEFEDLLTRITNTADSNFLWDVLYLCKRKVASYTDPADLEARIKGKTVVVI